MQLTAGVCIMTVWWLAANRQQAFMKVVACVWHLLFPVKDNHTEILEIASACLIRARKQVDLGLLQAAFNFSVPHFASNSVSSC